MLERTTSAWLIMGYGFAASVLPVWLLLAPRDYLSTFLKIGTVAVLAIAILVAQPELRMPAVTRELLAAHGPRWTHALAINDIYFDYAVPVLIEAARRRHRRRHGRRRRSPGRGSPRPSARSAW